MLEVLELCKIVGRGVMGTKRGDVLVGEGNGVVACDEVLDMLTGIEVVRWDILGDGGLISLTCCGLSLLRVLLEKGKVRKGCG